MPLKASENRKGGNLYIQVGTFLESYFGNAATDKSMEENFASYFFRKTNH